MVREVRVIARAGVCSNAGFGGKVHLFVLPAASLRLIHQSVGKPTEFRVGVSNIVSLISMHNDADA